MEKEIKCILLRNGEVIVSEVEEVFGDIGEPNCKLINPFLIKQDDNLVLETWMVSYTDQKTILISSDNIITLVTPTEKILEKYLSMFN